MVETSVGDCRDIQEETPRLRFDVYVEVKEREREADAASRPVPSCCLPKKIYKIISSQKEEIFTDITKKGVQYTKKDVHTNRKREKRLNTSYSRLLTDCKRAAKGCQRDLSVNAQSDQRPKRKTVERISQSITPSF